MIADHCTTELTATNLRLALYCFDPAYFQDTTSGDAARGELVFKLVAPPSALEPAGDVVYLELFNHHNGYYSHGFTMTVGGAVTKKGAI